MAEIKIVFGNQPPSIEDRALEILAKYYNVNKANNVTYPYCARLDINSGGYSLETLHFWSQLDSANGFIYAGDFLRAYDKFMNTPIVNNKKQQNKLWKSE